MNRKNYILKTDDIIFQHATDEFKLIPRRRIISKPLNQGDYELISSYLQNPTKSGIWYLVGKWNKNSGISKYVLEEFDSKLKNPNAVSLSSGNQKVKLKINNELKSKARENITSRVSFINSLFTHIHLLNKKSVNTREFRELKNDDENIVYDLVDLKKLKKKFGDAYEYFKKEIYFDGFTPAVLDNELFHIKKGPLLIVEGPADKGQLIFSSICRDTLDSFAAFCTKLDKLSEVNIYPIFPPEEKVFSPYFTFLESAYQNLFKDNRVIELFDRAFQEYKEEKYISCISTIGVIAEDYLTQVYETYFRDVCPKGYAMGQIYDLIHSSIHKITQPTQKISPDPKPIYTKLKAIQLNIESNPTNNYSVEILNVIRELVTMIKDERNYLKQQFSLNDKKAEIKSIFPKPLRDNLTELIKNRNAASHNSRVPIGAYEALRTVYDLVSLYMWWESEKEMIDWNNTKEEILIKSIERNCQIPAL
ncbi:MAG: hypothetical protein WAU11_07315 [Ignavibacteriaceae bacterium]